MYTYFNGGDGGSTSSEINRQHPAGSAGDITYMKACLTADPDNGAGVQSVSFTERIASADSSTTCTITEGDGDLCCESTTASAYTAAQLIDIEVTPANTPAASNFKVITHTVDSTANTMIFGSKGTNASNSETNYQAFQAGSVPQTDKNLTQIPVPFDWTFAALYCETLFGSPGGGNSYTMTIYDNGVAVGDISCVISGTGTTCNDTASTASGSAGDTVSLEIIPASTPTARPIGCGLALTNTVGGFALFGGSTGNYPDATNTYYHPLANSFSYSATETDKTQNISAVTLRTAYGALFTAPDNGAGTQSYTYTVRDDTAGTGCSFAVSEAEITNSDTACTDVIAVDSAVGYELVPANTPAATGGWVSVSAILTSEIQAEGRRVILVQ